MVAFYPTLHKYLPKVECEDEHSDCALWADQGTCIGAFMEAKCRKTCNYCESSVVPILQDEEKVITVLPKLLCEDEYSHCAVWAEKETCNGAFMEAKCRKTCNFCDIAIAQCEDGNENCAFWAKLGSCNQPYMHVKCRQSCNYCG
ncbi:unnamed protein product, partial [Meganyctiphanes norvegica]